MTLKHRMECAGPLKRGLFSPTNTCTVFDSWLGTCGCGESAVFIDLCRLFFNLMFLKRFYLVSFREKEKEGG